MSRTMPEILVASYLSIGADIASLVLALPAVALVRGIDTRETASSRRLGLGGDAASSA